MKKLFLLGVLALLCLISTKARSQDFDNNLDKYWKFRDRLRQDFVRIGSEQGQSIPAGARSIGLAYSGAPLTSQGLKPSRIYYTDATIYLGHYITVLATEYKLLNDASQNVESTLNELYYAVSALNRLDYLAEQYHNEPTYVPTPNDLNGMMLRDDVSLYFHEDNFANDYSETFERNADIIRTHSDYNPLEIWGTATTLAGYNYDFTERNISSQDQYYALFIGLRAVYDLVGNITVQPTPSSLPMNLKTESKAIVNRMLDQIVHVEDALGNDIQAIQLFHEILTDDLDRSNETVRFMMNWGLDYMKSAVENCFTNGDLSVANNQTSFETPVSQYVDVLNFMTDTILTADTYKEQFYVELNKGQLFKTLEKPILAKSIFLHLDDCELDSMEQSILNTWKTQIEIDMSVRSQFEEGVPMDSILFESGTQSSFEPESFVTSNYYFGVWINSPSSLSFVNCGSNAVYRNLYLTNITAELYPNPTSDVLNVRITDGEEAFDKLTIFNAAGQIVLSSRVQLSNGDMYTLQLPSEISTGTYILRLSNEHFVSDMTFQKY